MTSRSPGFTRVTSRRCCTTGLPNHDAQEAGTDTCGRAALVMQKVTAEVGGSAARGSRRIGNKIRPRRTCQPGSSFAAFALQSRVNAAITQR